MPPWKYSENLNRLSRAHERYRRQTDRRQTEGRATANSRSLKISRQCKLKVRRFQVLDANVLKLEQLVTAVGSMFRRLTTATENVHQDTAVLWLVQRFSEYI